MLEGPGGKILGGGEHHGWVRMVNCCYYWLEINGEEWLVMVNNGL
jgi:hypothetical protein